MTYSFFVGEQPAGRSPSAERICRGGLQRGAAKRSLHDERHADTFQTDTGKGEWESGGFACVVVGRVFEQTWPRTGEGRREGARLFLHEMSDLRVGRSA